MADDDDEGELGGLYENGHWIWDDSSDALLFVSDLPPKPIEAVQILNKVPTGAIDFRDDVDLIEQIRFRRRYQRKLAPGEPDIITLQDVKDIAIYTAPVKILSPMLINMLHLSTTDRFLRALILSSAYYLQITDEMSLRILEMDTKVRTPACEILENEFRDNLSDLRLLVAKEYCLMLIGGGDTKSIHHMGPTKKRRSLSDKDARLFETFLCISVQIVWLALGRKNFHQIGDEAVRIGVGDVSGAGVFVDVVFLGGPELETNRLFRSEIFNIMEHNLKTGHISKMAPEERAVLLGHCLRHNKKITTRSPLMNEVFCDREINYHLMGLGVFKYKGMSRRLKYLRDAVAAKEDELNVPLGIIGMARTKFDTMLRPLSQGSDKSATHVTLGFKTASREQQSSPTVPQRLYPEIVLPPRDTREYVLATGKYLQNLMRITKQSLQAKMKLNTYSALYLHSLTELSVFAIIGAASFVALRVYVPLFPEEQETIIPVNVTQRRIWLNRLKKLIRGYK